MGLKAPVIENVSTGCRSVLARPGLEVGANRAKSFSKD
jgi:hypothetical protein